MFVLGNYIYTLENADLIIKIVVSELCFICFYTLTDKGNISYGIKFTFLLWCMILSFLHPVYNFLFYSNSVKVFSIAISSLAIFINYIILNNLLSRGLKNVLISRISTGLASVVEISLFAYLLDIGLIGAMITALVRAMYLIAVPYLIFYKNNLQ